MEIKSRPIATIDTPVAPEAAAPQEDEKGVASIFKRILPDLRRPASTDATRRVRRRLWASNGRTAAGATSRHRGYGPSALVDRMLPR